MEAAGTTPLIQAKTVIASLEKAASILFPEHSATITLPEGQTATFYGETVTT